MNAPARNEIIDESRAAYLLGLPREQFRLICEYSGYGRMDDGENVGDLFFTYEELNKLCRLVTGPVA